MSTRPRETASAPAQRNTPIVDNLYCRQGTSPAHLLSQRASSARRRISSHEVETALAALKSAVDHCSALSERWSGSRLVSLDAVMPAAAGGGSLSCMTLRPPPHSARQRSGLSIALMSTDDSRGQAAFHSRAHTEMAVISGARGHDDGACAMDYSKNHLTFLNNLQQGLRSVHELVCSLNDIQRQIGEKQHAAARRYLKGQKKLLAEKLGEAEGAQARTCFLSVVSPGLSHPTRLTPTQRLVTQTI
jgi:hypothetical protein